jgi:16S rRNA (cytosine1402-N4)-methyltransferase
MTDMTPHNQLPGGRHLPVMIDEVLEALEPRDRETYVDGTFGDGGYSEAILQAADCKVLGIDRDPVAVERGRAIAARYNGRLAVVRGRFGDLDEILEAEKPGPINGVVLDLGVSSNQLDDAERGFSFRFDGPLDMRMGSDGQSAADIVNALDETALADIIYRYGEERKSRRIARAIIARRRETPILRTLELADIVSKAIGPTRPGQHAIHPATRTFQALRIYVNDELEELESGLSAAERALAPEGRLVVVSFHSLEDRCVKDFLRDRSGGAPRPSRHTPPVSLMQDSGASSFRLIHRKAVRPSEAEIARNPRSRSARLRAAIRTSAPALDRDRAKERKK